MAQQLHSLLTANHRPYADVYADATERLAATGFKRVLGGGTLGATVPFTAEDLYKKVLQVDDASEWILTATTPTWVQVSGAGSLANDSVTNAKLANMAQATIKGRAAGAGTGDPTDLSATQATAILNTVVGDSGSGGTKGLAPAPGAGDAAAGKYLDAAGGYSVPPGTVTTEAIQDIVGAMLVGGEYDDGAGTLRVGYLEIPQNSQSSNYTAVLSDQAYHLFHPVGDNNPRTFTIPANSSVAFRVGTAITFVNKINTLTIAITTDTLTWAEDGSTGSRTLAANGIATALKITSTEWLISGTGLS